MSEVAVHQGIVETDGADIYYERRGSGPPLLFIAGGEGGGRVWDGAAELLSEHFTVLTYDRRGHSRSRLRTPQRQFDILQQADDAAAVIVAAGFDAAIAFGTSGGALITLELIAAHPDRLLGAIAYEPPVITILPDRGEMFDWYDYLYRLVLEGDTMKAFDEFIERCGLTQAVADAFGHTPGSEKEREWRQARADNLAVLMRQEMQVFTYFRPDYETLETTKVPVFIGAGDVSLNLLGPNSPVFYAHAAQLVAERLKFELVQFSGDHAPWLGNRERFVTEVRPVLARLQS